MRHLFPTVGALALVFALWFWLAGLPDSSPPPAPVLAAPTPADAAQNVAPIQTPPTAAVPVTPSPAASMHASTLTPAELQLKARIERKLAAAQPTHRITFDAIKTLTGWIVTQTANHVTFSESYGDAGSMSVNIARRRIVSLETLSNAALVITDRDVRFQSEFPTFNLFKRHPYTILTDESFFQVERVVSDLQKTYQQFSLRFRPLVRRDRAAVSDVQVLVFSSQAAFRRYATTHFGATNEIAGFYMLEPDRLVVFNQQTANWIPSVIEQEEREAMAHYGDSPELRAQMAERRPGREQDLRWFARQFSRETVRHEGAHQMSYTLGVLRPYPRPLLWLSEGIALYSETDPVGEVSPWRVAEFKSRFDKNDYPSLQAVIVASQQPDYLQSYSSYWMLAFFLMHRDRRDEFFSFIRTLNEPDHWKNSADIPDLTLLCRTLKTDPASLEREWRRFLGHL